LRQSHEAVAGPTGLAVVCYRLATGLICRTFWGARELGTRFGNLLRESRRKAGYSISGLAGLLEMTPAQLSAIERGIEGLLTDEQIVRIAGMFGSNAALFLTAKEKDLDEAFQKQWPVRDALKQEQEDTRRKGKAMISKKSPLKKVP
jgi:transcriptional regulator with XRE-family HTH domain